MLLGQPAEGEVLTLLRRSNCAMPAPCLSEVVDKLMRKRRVESAVVAERLGPLLDEVISIVGTDRRTAWRAGELRAEHYHRSESDLSQVDCLLLATAGEGDEIASSDESLLRVASRIGVGAIPLPDSSGRRPAID